MINIILKEKVFWKLECFFFCQQQEYCLDEVFEFVFEVRYVAVVVYQLLVIIGLGWVGGWVDVEVQCVVFFVLGGFGLEGGVVCYYDIDDVVFGMDIVFY